MSGLARSDDGSVSMMSAFSWVLLLGCHVMVLIVVHPHGRSRPLGADVAEDVREEKNQGSLLWELLLLSSLGDGLVASVAMAWRCFPSSATYAGLLPGCGGSVVAGLLPLGRLWVCCWPCGVPGVDHYVMLWASRGPRCVATLLLYISRLDLFTPSTIT